jgi:hypothetical protein
MEGRTPDHHCYAFGGFRLDATRRLILTTPEGR